MRFYSLSRFEGVYLRELTSCHREGISGLDLSQNGGFMLTGGDDNLLKLWDSDAQKTVPYYFQAFIGHIYPVTACMFSPANNRTIYTTGEKDGIYVWRFYGDTQTNMYPEGADAHQEAYVEVPDRNKLNEPSNLERMRMQVKELKKPVLGAYAFVVPEFDNCDELNLGVGVARKELRQTLEETPEQYYAEQVERMNLSYKHFVSVQPILKVETQVGIRT